MVRWLCYGVSILIGSAPLRTAAQRDADTGAPVLHYEVLAEYPHDTSAFTEGLVYANGHLYESTGGYGHSDLREVDLKSGQVQRRQPLPAQYFGEGLAQIRDRWYQLSWRSQTGFIYDDDFRPLRQFHYRGEGWGLAYDGQSLIRSDGSSTLEWWNPEDFSVQRRVSVHDGAKAIDKINELEVANGQIYANIWQSDWVITLSPRDGRVTGWINLHGLTQRFTRGLDWDAADDVLNGIAYDADCQCFYVTGKRWPKVFTIRMDGAR